MGDKAVGREPDDRENGADRDRTGNPCLAKAIRPTLKILKIRLISYILHLFRSFASCRILSHEIARKNSIGTRSYRYVPFYAGSDFGPVRAALRDGHLNQYHEANKQLNRLLIGSKLAGLFKPNEARLFIDDFHILLGSELPSVPLKKEQ